MERDIDNRIEQANARERHRYRYHRWIFKGLLWAFVAWMMWDLYRHAC